MKICSAEECNEKHYAKGYCKKHYLRIWKNGTLIIIKNPKNHKEYKNPNWKNGKSSHYLYKIYYDMIGRCTRITHVRYKDYGGRGIIVCERWKDNFWNFVEDMGERPEGYLLDRMDNNKGYYPENCRWVDKFVSAKNKRGYGIEYRQRNNKGQFI
jgi:hypothetical protein